MRTSVHRPNTHVPDAGPVKRPGDRAPLADPTAPRQAMAARGHGAPPAIGDLLAGRRGAPLDAALRTRMESAFGVDFGAVRIHADADAATSASALDARAYTVGQHVVFGAGEYAPQTVGGRELIAHELAHTLQQRTAPPGTGAALSTREASADRAGRAAANGVAVSQPQPATAISVARNVATADNFDDAEIAERLKKYTERLKQPAYPERESDLLWVGKLREVADRRARAGRPAAPARPAAPRQPPPPTREQVAAEAEAWVARSTAEDEAEEAADKAAEAPRAAPPKSRFSPMGFKDAQADALVAPDRNRLEAELAPPSDPRPFRDRIAEARRRAPMTVLSDDFPRSVWDYGLGHGLFSVREEIAVLQTLRAPKLAERAAAARRQKMEAERQRQLQHEAVISNMNVNMIGAFATAPGKGFLAMTARLLATPQRAFATAQGINAGRALADGDASALPDLAIAAVPHVYFRSLGRTPRLPTFRGPGRGPAQSGGSGGSGGSGRTGAAEPVTPAQVRAAYAANRFSVQKSSSHEWHQQVWERHGGSGPAPLAFRAGDVIRVNELRWLAVGELAEINTPGDLAPSRVVPTPARPGAGGGVDPRAATRPAVDPRAATAAGVDPRAATQAAVNPRAATQPAVDPRAATAPGIDPRAPTAPVVDPRAATGVPSRPGGATQHSVPPQQPASAPPGAQPRFRPQPAVPAGPRGYTPVEPAVVVEAFQLNRDAIVPSYSSAFHASVWRHGGGGAQVPLAFRVGSKIRVDVDRLPADVRAAIGYAMKL